MAIYDTLATTCDEQCSIVDEGVDYIILSSVLGALPRLREIFLHFDQIPQGQEWLTRFLQYSQMTMHERSCQHHIRVVSNALRRARNRGIQVQAVNLSGLCCSARDTRQKYFWGRLSEPLTELLGSAQVFRVARSSYVVEVLSQCALTLRQFDMCHIVVRDESLKMFLQRNKKSLRSIGFHNVSNSQLDQSGISISKLSSDMLRRMLNVVPHSAPCQVTDCDGCPRPRPKGWRLALEPDHLQNMAGDPVIVEPSLEVPSGSAYGITNYSK
jgi:hypothetical protein